MNFYGYNEFKTKKKKMRAKNYIDLHKQKQKKKKTVGKKINGMESPESKREIIFIMFVISDERKKKPLAKKKKTKYATMCMKQNKKLYNFY